MEARSGARQTNVCTCEGMEANLDKARPPGCLTRQIISEMPATDKICLIQELNKLFSRRTINGTRTAHKARAVIHTSGRFSALASAVECH